MSLAEDPTFTTVRMREGYEMGEVDDHLDRLADELRRREPPADPSGADPHQSVVRRQSSLPRPDLVLLAIVVVVLVAVLILAR